MAKRKWTDEEVDDFRRTHNNSLIYYNEEDGNLFVPKAYIHEAFRMWPIAGRTVNWAHPIAQIFLFVLLTLIILPVIFNILWRQ
ncbi:hypothetical protein Desaci_1296 [Desulfosporosinus acidiphilus SJ4]|uniref:DUF5808 domain-containing protein n=1 Tax=Desulfosporosinus acidiphilus (strain DSM 22704 / JCM 16185 / SJ4) TaxID=646529 RepID=I4D3E8_DESAJ|nr:hypothetical protein [Desulfosporosinus acidiphilus]AFM40322.1 hypothetical protein Desaci_1296 [Desulfosporosinus acidiphilus SJ4]